MSGANTSNTGVIFTKDNGTTLVTGSGILYEISNDSSITVGYNAPKIILQTPSSGSKMDLQPSGIDISSNNARIQLTTTGLDICGTTHVSLAALSSLEGITGPMVDNFVDLSGQQTIIGSKTFTQEIQGSIESVRDGVYTRAVDQHISGTKTFTEGLKCRDISLTDLDAIIGESVSYAANVSFVASYVDSVINEINELKPATSEKIGGVILPSGADHNDISVNALGVLSLPNVFFKDITGKPNVSSQTISGETFFTNAIRADICGNAGSVTDGVYLSDNQEITGSKYFSNTLQQNIAINVILDDFTIISDLSTNAVGNFTINGHEQPIMELTYGNKYRFIQDIAFSVHTPLQFYTDTALTQTYPHVAISSRDPLTQTEVTIDLDLSSADIPVYLYYDCSENTGSAIGNRIFIKGSPAILDTFSVQSISGGKTFNGAVDFNNVVDFGSNVTCVNLSATGLLNAPTPDTTINSTIVATTAYVKANIADLKNSVVDSLDTLKELADAIGNDPQFFTTIHTHLDSSFAEINAQIDADSQVVDSSFSASDASFQSIANTFQTVDSSFVLLHAEVNTNNTATANTFTQLNNHIDASFAVTDSSFTAVANSFANVAASFAIVDTSFIAVQDKFDIVAISFDTVDSSFASVANTFMQLNNHIDASFAAVDASFSIADASFAAVDASFLVADTSFATIATSFANVAASFAIGDSSFATIDTSFISVQNKFNTVASNFATVDTSFSLVDDHIDASFAATANTFTVVNNHIDASFQVADTSFQTIDNTFQIVDDTFLVIDASFQAVEASFNIVDTSFQVVDASFQTVSDSFQTVDANFQTVDTSFQTTNTHLQVHDDSLLVVDASLGEMVNTIAGSQTIKGNKTFSNGLIVNVEDLTDQILFESGGNLDVRFRCTDAGNDKYSKIILGGFNQTTGHIHLGSEDDQEKSAGIVYNEQGPSFQSIFNASTFTLYSKSSGATYKHMQYGVDNSHVEFWGDVSLNNPLSTFKGQLEGNAETASLSAQSKKLEAIHNIAGKPFDGTQDISIDLNDLANVNTTTSPPTYGQALIWDNAQWTAGKPEVATYANLATQATQLSHAHNIAGQPFDGLQDVIIELDDLSGVDISMDILTNGQALVWNDSSGVWNPGNVAAAGGGGGGGGGIWSLESNNIQLPNSITKVQMHDQEFVFSGSQRLLIDQRTDTSYSDVLIPASSAVWTIADDSMKLPTDISVVHINDVNFKMTGTAARFTIDLTDTPEYTVGPSQSIGWDVSGGHIIYNGEGNIGIGTKDPQSALDVSGDIIVRNDSGAKITLQSDEINFSSSGTIDGSQILMNPTASATAGKVGIGTDVFSTPTITHVNSASAVGNTKDKLHVKGNIRVSNAALSAFMQIGGPWNEAGVIDTYNTTMMLNPYSRQNIKLCENGGHVGIGTVSPTFPLHILGKVYTGIGNSHQYHNNGLTYTGNTSFDVAVRVENGGIWVGGEVIYNSDKRIKTDISNIDDDRALQQVNALESKEYHYIDPIKRRDMKTIGFIAQDVKEVLPNAVSLQSNWTPDEMRILDNLDWSGNVLTIPDLDMSFENLTGRCKFFVSNDSSGNNEIKAEIESEKNASGNNINQFKFEQQYTNVFFYGKEVNDFHTIDKNQIFALHHSAIQELSRKNDVKAAQIVTLQSENTAKTGEIAILMADNVQLKADISLIKQHLGI